MYQSVKNHPSTIIRSVLALAFLAAGSLLFAQTPAKPDFHLELIHVNDTHSHFEPALTKLVLDLDDTLKAKPVYLEMGGFPQLAQAIQDLRSTSENPLVIHAGDFFQGTLYFTKYIGDADVAFWNLVRPDAATLGNHEFDKGPQVLKDNFLSKVNFPVLDANLDASKEPILKDSAPAAYKILTLGKSKVGVIGATTTETPYISSPGNNIQFLDPEPAIQKAADALTKAGVNKIILVSHLGTDVDLQLATRLKNVDVIVGGHSHTLLGDWKPLGLSSFGSYPVALKDKNGDPILVVSSWEWGKILGDLGVDFDAKGKVIASKDNSRILAGTGLVQVYDLPNPAGELKRVRFAWNNYNITVTVYDGKDWKEASADTLTYWIGLYQKTLAAVQKTGRITMNAGSPAAWTLARSFALGVQDLQRTVVSQVGDDLKRALNAGPGPIVADAMRAYTGAQIAITNAGGIRIDLLPGPLTTAKVYEVIPFGNTLVNLKATGAQVKDILEDAADFALGKYGTEFPANPVTYVSGLRFALAPAQAKGSRVSALELLLKDGTYASIDPAATYTLTVNNFIASGGDKYETLGKIGGKTDTGMIDAEAFFAYVKNKTISSADIGERILIIK